MIQAMMIVVQLVLPALAVAMLVIELRRAHSVEARVLAWSIGLSAMALALTVAYPVALGDISARLGFVFPTTLVAAGAFLVLSSAWLRLRAASPEPGQSADK